ncbi:hypothetical protein HOD75_03115 [archaeon]|jgi:hypothetical protein|nr:hypothetical protein [archaeon]MBT4241863.1 hypothetical protein [archaeon]MBT4418410.1 hypothetical protein [archaeon]
MTTKINTSTLIFFLILISCFTLLTLFITPNSKNNLTGFAINDQNDSNQTIEQGEIYSEQSYVILYMILTITICLIAVIGIILLSPKIKAIS